MFDTNCIKGKKDIQRWKPLCFRTNGTQVDVTFVSGVVKGAMNSECLIDSGYGIPIPDKKININRKLRGLHYVTVPETISRQLGLT